MCGRFTLTADGEALQKALGLDMLPDVSARYNVAPSQPVAVVTNQQPTQLDYYRWGLVPHWADDPAIGNRMINARSETAHEKPSFRAAFQHRRCLIPADGFYEWQASNTGKHKQPMYIFLDDHPVFAFAGLWEQWQSPDRSELRTCTILTTEANPRIKDVHHRMPVILQPDAYETWLQSDEQDMLRGLLGPYTGDDLDYYPVSRRVNKPQNDSPENIVPVEGDAQQLSLF